MSIIYYGEIKEEKFKSWKNNKEPNEILIMNNEIHRLSGWNFYRSQIEYLVNKCKWIGGVLHIKV